MGSHWQVCGHSRFSWAGRRGSVPVGHTAFSWAGAADSVDEEHAALVESMDDSHFERYLDLENADTWVCPWQPSSATDIDGLVSFAGITSSDKILDVGCGDGRVLLRLAASMGCGGVGVDISPECVEAARKIAQSQGCAGVVRFVETDFVGVLSLPDLDTVTIAYVYLVPKALAVVRPVLEQLSEMGIRIITHEYHYTDWSGRHDPVHDLTELGDLRK
eukprot:CAMPEP_0184510076 /NCGR_PEP_ID=MMETSP0198_2-20121128/1619_1 /TAXON_ID=1112570 /ORGANISM="Thraustochytrium sp., Strain LLF1b" /LENGTH=217 /DNA_ID=CAMNT_0026899939 /DNA_START=836 /DNA_END=1486 /DNA_ORIENTATION=-